MPRINAPANQDGGARRARTGPIGRLARLLIAVIAALSLYSIADQGGPASFHDPSNLSEPITWVLHTAMFTVFVLLIGQLGPRRSAQPVSGAGRCERCSRWSATCNACSASP